MSCAGVFPGSSFGAATFPFIAPERCLAELDELDLALPALLHDNAARVLRL